MYVVLTALCALPILVAVQVVGIHVKDGAELRARGKQQAQTYVTLPAVRGSIYDANGRTLAVNTARHDLAVDPTFGDFNEHAEAFFARLSEVTGRSPSYYRRRISRRADGSQFVALDRDLSETQRASIESWGYEFVILNATFNRRYNYETTLAHVLGHVNADGTGAAGLELQYDEFLRGRDGRRERGRDARGSTRALVGGGDVAPVHGESLVLTIDIVLQSLLEEALADGVAQSSAKWATAVALDPRTGAVIAMANVPTYDPNRPSAYSAEFRRNRAVTDQIEPGSTFKLVSAVAALETRTARLTDEVDTGVGFAVFGGRTMRDTHANGVISLAKAISISSNIGIARIAERIDDKKLYEYARNLGFGQRTWIDLPGEVSGVLKKPSSWSGTTKTSMSIGYEVTVTALQLANAYAAFANEGRLLQPYVVSERRDINGDVTWRTRPDSVRVAFRSRTADELLDAFEAVITEGTAMKARVAGVRIAGKTGTANKVIEGHYVTGRSRASFVGFFPADDPQVVLAVMMDEPQTSIYGGDVSAPVFRRVVEGWLPLMLEVYAEPDDEAELATPIEELPVPNVEGAPLAVARGMLRTAGLQVSAPRRASNDKIVGSVKILQARGDVAVAAVSLAEESGPFAAFAAAESPDSEPATASIEGSEETEVMPDLTGLGTRQAVYWLQAKNIDVKVEGHGRVVSQTPQAGESLSGEARLVCR